MPQIPKTITPNDRHIKFLAILEANPSQAIYKSAIQAGFTENTARKNSKQLIIHALKRQAVYLKNLKDKEIITEEEEKKLSFGVTREELDNRIVALMKQDKDTSTAYKVTKDIYKAQEGIQLGDSSQQQAVTPILNIGISLNPPTNEAIEEKKQAIDITDK